MDDTGISEKIGIEEECHRLACIAEVMRRKGILTYRASPGFVDITLGPSPIDLAALEKMNKEEEAKEKQAKTLRELKNSGQV